MAAGVIEGSIKIFDGNPFLLPADEKGRQRVSIALYDAIAVALYRRLDRLDDFITKRHHIKIALHEELKTNLELLTGKANTAQSIKDRIARVGQILDASA